MKKRKGIKKGWSENKQDNTKTNKKYPEVIHHRENEIERRMVYNFMRIRGRRNNISKSY